MCIQSYSFIEGIKKNHIPNTQNINLFPTSGPHVLSGLHGSVEQEVGTGKLMQIYKIYMFNVKYKQQCEICGQ